VFHATSFVRLSLMLVLCSVTTGHGSAYTWPSEGADYSGGGAAIVVNRFCKGSLGLVGKDLGSNRRFGDVIVAKVIGQKCPGILSAPEIAELQTFIDRLIADFTKSAKPADAAAKTAWLADAEAKLARGFHGPDACTGILANSGEECAPAGANGASSGSAVVPRTCRSKRSCRQLRLCHGDPAVLDMMKKAHASEYRYTSPDRATRTDCANADCAPVHERKAVGTCDGLREVLMVRRSTCMCGLLLAGSLLVLAAPASAQNFNQAIVFGDSTVDSGAYKGLASPGGGKNFNDLWLDAVAAGAGKPTTSPGLMNSEALAAMFGLTAKPASQPGIPGEAGGTNYATSGARSDLVNTPGSGLFNAAVPMSAQINNYLTAAGGHANPNALFLINGGGNDVAFAVNQNRSVLQAPIFPLGSAEANSYLVTQASTLAASVAQLKAAGARYIIVPNEAFSFPKGNGALATAERADKLLFSQTLWSELSVRGVNFIPADFNSVRVAIAADQSSFGFEFIDTALGHTACTKPNGINSAWALLCSNNPNAPSQLAAPNADQTRLFADNEHLSTAGEKIEADYFYSLIVAPSQISFLAENAVKARSRLINAAQNQIDVSERQQRGPAGFNVWVTGDVSHLGMNNYNGFPDDPSTPATYAVGADVRLTPHIIVGAIISAGTQHSNFSTAGSFTQDEIAASIYASYRAGPWWGNVIGTYGRLDYDVNRTVPIGITLQFNNASTSGRNWSLATEGGYKFRAGPFTHGPVAGLTLQRVTVDGFTETGGFTSLSFGDQTRDSLISALGYRAALELGAWQPFAQVVWNHELANTDRDVTARLTTITAPGYSMPGVVLGKDWGTVSLGTTWKITSGLTALGAVTADFGQRDVTTYGAQIGLNVTF
jgi:outer membrane lipase/esterase